MYVSIHHWTLRNIRKQHLQKHISVTLSNVSKHSDEIYFYKYFKKDTGFHYQTWPGGGQVYEK